MKIESVILSSLIHNENFLKKVNPFLKQEYFKNRAEQKILELIQNFFKEYSKMPTKEVLAVSLNEESIDEDLFKEANTLLQEIKTEVDVDPEWLLVETEKFCKDRAIYIAILESVKILDDEKKPKEGIPLLLEDALSISFDRNVGHDFLVDAISRYDYLHSDESRLTFDIDMLNVITGGRGIPKKTLTILMATTGAGKSLGLGHIAADFLTQGKNVLFITLELSDMRVAERIDANLLDTALDDLAEMDKATYLRGVRKIAEKTQGRLIIKEYPTSSAHAGHFESLLNELKLKKNFVPEIVIVDYINLCLSQRYGGAGHNSYTIVKGIAEELRRIAVKYNVAMFSATQMNRCLDVETLVEREDDSKVMMKDLKIGDKILSSEDKYVEVKKIYPIEKQKVYRIRTKSGKTIIASGKHIFPTSDGLSSIETGMDVGSSLFVRHI